MEAERGHMSTATRRFTEVDARRLGTEIGIDWDTAAFDVEQFRMGLEVELEHGLHDPETNVTGDDPTPHREDRLGASQGAAGLLHAAASRWKRPDRPARNQPPSTRGACEDE